MIKDVCQGTTSTNLATAGQLLIPYLQENAQKAAIFGMVPVQDPPVPVALRIYPHPSNSYYTIEGLRNQAGSGSAT